MHPHALPKKNWNDKMHKFADKQLAKTTEINPEKISNSILMRSDRDLTKIRSCR